MNDYMNYIDAAVQANMPKYYELKRNIKFNLRVEDLVFEIEFRAPEYWKYANYGRGPGKFPPPSSIDKWITRRKIVPYPLKDGRVPSKSQLVYLISRKIAEKGFEGSGFLEKSLEDQSDYWEGRIADAVYQDVIEEFKVWATPVFGDSITI